MREQLIILLSCSPVQKTGGQDSTHYTVQKLWNELVHITGRKVYIGIGREARGIKDFENSYKDASFSIKYLKLTKQKEQVVAFKDLGLYQALADESAAGLLYNLMRDILDPLLNSDKKKGTSYLKTLDYYFIAGCSIKTAAERLFCHVNTVRYRLDRAKKLSQVDIDDVERRFDIQMSLNIAKFYYPEFFMPPSGKKQV
jgi:DNA-binding PucR family transcriptional regulator